MISEKMIDTLNNQVNAELYSAYIYLSMSAYFESVNLKGFAHWMRLQAQEEVIHGMKIYDFISERGGRVMLRSVDSPPTEWDSPLAAFEGAYAHEQKMTKMINDLANLAISEGDHATNNFLQWFISEQVEEEASANDIVQKLKLVGGSPQGLFMVDHELGQRTLAAAEPSGGGS